MSEYLKTLEPLIRQKLNLTDAREFHDRVNVIFHNEEAKHYDKLHTEMWESLPVQYDLLIADVKPHIKNNQPLKLLDVGCGTGLATQMLLNASMDKPRSRNTLAGCVGRNAQTGCKTRCNMGKESDSH